LDACDIDDLLIVSNDLSNITWLLDNSTTSNGKVPALYGITLAVITFRIIPNLYFFGPNKCSEK
jgi:hypothetical protein